MTVEKSDCVKLYRAKSFDWGGELAAAQPPTAAVATAAAAAKAAAKAAAAAAALVKFGLPDLESAKCHVP